METFEVASRRSTTHRWCLTVPHEPREPGHDLRLHHCRRGLGRLRLANRLSANPNTNVLLLEAGGRDINLGSTCRSATSRPLHNPDTDWCYKTHQTRG